MPPVVNWDGVDKIVPFSGQASGGAGGLATTTTITTRARRTPWSGTERIGERVSRRQRAIGESDRRTTMNRILLALVCLVVACSQPSGLAPILSASAVDVVSSPIAPTSRVAKLRAQMASRPPPPAAPDTRTPAQLAAAACYGGKCVGTGIPKLMMASGQTPIIPPSWTVPTWWIRSG